MREGEAMKYYVKDFIQEQTGIYLSVCPEFVESFLSRKGFNMKNIRRVFDDKGEEYFSDEEK